MENENIFFRPIGEIHSPFKQLAGMPIQPSAAEGIQGYLTVDPDLASGLMDLEGFSHLILTYYFHQAKEAQLQVKPFLDDQQHGVFATRAPRRPNAIGISVVKLVRITGNTLEIENVDILDGTPLLDIKPYVPEFDSPGPVRIGWLEKSRGNIPGKRSDDRFIK